MPDVPLTAAEDSQLAVEQLWWRQQSLVRTAPRHVRGIATYYRLRSAVLEAHVAALEADLEQTERQLETTIERYERLLQQPEEDWVVSTARGPDIEPSTDD
jgi:hypothetical protein